MDSQRVKCFYELVETVVVEKHVRQTPLRRDRPYRIVHTPIGRFKIITQFERVSTARTTRNILFYPRQTGNSSTTTRTRSLFHVFVPEMVVYRKCGSTVRNKKSDIVTDAYDIRGVKTPTKAKKKLL